MDLRICKYFLVPIIALAFFSCRQSKYVADGYYLLDDNEIMFSAGGDSLANWEDDYSQISKGDLEGLISPDPNSGLRLFIYNRIDSTRYKKQVNRKTEKFRRKNARRKAKEDKKNKKRIAKAKKKGKSQYKRKVKKPKTTRLGWRNWVVSHWGEAPVLLDTSKVSKSKQQMKVYLSQRGFKNAVISDSITIDEKRKKAAVSYFVVPGKPYVINSISFDPAPRNKSMTFQYKRMVRKEGTALEVGNLLDEDDFETERDHYTKFLKDNAYFGFTSSYINFIVDSTKGDHKADIVIYIKEKIIKDPYNPDTTRITPHIVYLVDDVTYKLHNPDTMSFKDWDTYKMRCEELGYQYPYKEDGHFVLLDTIFVEDTIVNVHRVNFNPDKRKKHNIKVFEKHADTVRYYKGYFLYNETPFLKPSILDKQNFLEHTDLTQNERHYAKDYYIDRTLRSFMRLDVFSKVSPSVYVKPSKPLGNYVDVTYDLTPAPKQQFKMEPRATNTSSILGISGIISYTNKNMFRAGNQLTFSVEGGFQSQPLVSGSDSTENRIQGLNTFEIGPEITYKMPKFYPMSKKMQENSSKRAYPSTEIGALYNFQKRPEFSRHIAEFGYKWKFSIPPDEIQKVTVTPLRFDYVFLDKQPIFDSTLNATNDPFLINSYSNFFSLGFLNAKHEFSNQAKPKTKRDPKKKHGPRWIEHIVSNVVQLTAAGLVMNSIYALADKDSSFVPSFSEDGKEIFNVPFAQYAKLENTFIFNQFISKKHRIAYRLLMGTGFSYGNGLALPYTQSFVAGGSNDIRAFAARRMAPGGTQTWKDSTATETQIGDMKLELNLEWRFNFGGQLNGAIFLDMGNIWKIKADDPNDPGLFSFKDFYRQVAIGTGFGLRYDLTFLILRLDVAWAIHNPYLDPGNRWWRNSNIDNWKLAVEEDKGTYDIRDWPFGPKLNFGIGYPF